MSSLSRLVSIAIIASTVIGCSGETDVETESSGDTFGAIPESAPVDADTDSTPTTVLPEGTDSLGAVGSERGAIDRPVVTVAEQQRIDDWLAAYADSLNDYGDPKGTMYAGGTPLFNESAGKPVSKYEYIAVKHPEKPWSQPLPEGRPIKREEKKSGDKGTDDAEDGGE